MPDFYCAFGSGGEMSVKSSWIVQGPQTPETMETNCPGLHAIFENDPDIQRIVFERGGDNNGFEWHGYQIYGRVQPEEEPEPEPEPAPDPRDVLKMQLVALIESWSEDRYAAGWMGGIEDELWSHGGVWHILGEAIGEWPHRDKDTDYEIVWRPLPEVPHG